MIGGGRGLQREREMRTVRRLRRVVSRAIIIIFRKADDKAGRNFRRNIRLNRKNLPTFMVVRTDVIECFGSKYVSRKVL